jgi:uncharacterized membrane protein SirB2
MHAYYPWIKLTHVSMVTLTACFFVLRFFWMIRYPTLLQQAWVKRAPVIIDTTLLASGITMAVLTQQYPLQQAWLTGKVIALIAYIILGSIALKRGSTLRIRITAGVLALVSVSYIIITALSRNPFPLNFLFT